MKARDEFSGATRCIDRRLRFASARRFHRRTMQQMAPRHTDRVPVSL